MKTIMLVLASRMLGTLLNFVITALVIRVAPAEEAAAYIYCFVVSNLVQFFGATSLEWLLVKHVHQQEDKERIDLSAYVWAALALLAAPYLAALIYFAVQSERPEVFMTFLAASVWTVATVISTPLAYLRARVRSDLESIITLSIMPVFFVVKVAMVVMGVHAKFVFLVFAVEVVVFALIASRLPIARGVRFLGPPRWREIVATVRAAVPFIAAVGAANVYLRAAFLVFTPLLGAKDIVVVGVIGQLLTAAGLVPYGLQQAMYPALQRVDKDEQRFRLLFQGGCAASVLWGAAVAAGLVVLGNWFVDLVFPGVGPIAMTIYLLLGLHLGLQTLVNWRNYAVIVKASPGELLRLHAVSMALAFAVSFALTIVPTIIGFAWALAATAFAGLIAGVVSPASRRYRRELYGWARPDQLWLSLRAIPDGFKR